MTYGSLFSGVGGIDLGLDRSGMKCLWQIEKDEYAQKILAKHWPDTVRYRDIRYFLGSKRWRRVREAWAVDLIAGGPPCQPISVAGRRRGDKDPRWLWPELFRIVRLLRPRYLLLENPTGILSSGFGYVLAELAQFGYAADWTRISAASVGAPHLRWRIFIVSYSPTVQREAQQRGQQNGVDGILAADPQSSGRQSRRTGDVTKEQEWRQSDRSVIGPDVPNANNIFTKQLRREQFQEYCARTRRLYWPQTIERFRGVDAGTANFLDGTPSPVCDVQPNRVDRLRCLGNSVVPQIAEFVGRLIMEFERNLKGDG